MLSFLLALVAIYILLAVPRSYIRFLVVLSIALDALLIGGALWLIFGR